MIEDLTLAGSNIYIKVMDSALLFILLLPFLHYKESITHVHSVEWILSDGMFALSLFSSQYRLLADMTICNFDKCEIILIVGEHSFK